MAWRCLIQSEKCDSSPSVEHVLPADLGGSLTARDLICRGCNSWLGSNVDGPFSKQFELMLGMLGITNARDRSLAKGITFAVNDNDLYRYDPNTNAIAPVRVVKTEELPDGRTRMLERLPVETDLSAYVSKLRERYAKRGYLVEPGEIKTLSEPAPGVPHELVVDEQYRRAVAKVGFLFTAYVRRGTDFSERAYDPIRSFIAGGTLGERMVSFPTRDHLALCAERFPKHLLTSFVRGEHMYAHVVLFGVLVHLVRVGPAPVSYGNAVVAYELDPHSHMSSETPVAVADMSISESFVDDPVTLHAGAHLLKQGSELLARARGAASEAEIN